MAYHDTLDNETRAYLANKGWDRLTDEQAAQAIAKSYINLEKIRPVPAEVPKTAADYNFEGVVAEPAVLEHARTLAFSLKLPNDYAKALATQLAADATAAGEASTAAATVARTAAEGALKAAWKDDHDNNMALSNKALLAAGFSAEDIAAMETVKGFDKVHEMGYGLAQKMGEAPLLKGGQMDNQTPKWTRETALAERNRLMTDQEFGGKFMAGDAASVKMIEDLSRAIVGTPDNWQPPPENFGRQHDHLGHEVLPGSPGAV